MQDCPLPATAQVASQQVRTLHDFNPHDWLHHLTSHFLHLIPPPIFMPMLMFTSMFMYRSLLSCLLTSWRDRILAGCSVKASTWILTTPCPPPMSLRTLSLHSTHPLLVWLLMEWRSTLHHCLSSHPSEYPGRYVLSCTVLSSPTLSCPVLCCPSPLCPVLLHTAFNCSALPCSVLPCPLLPCHSS